MNYQGCSKLILFIALSVFTIGEISAQFTIPPKPNKQTSLYDYAKLLEAVQAAQLKQKLINYYDSTGTQIVVAIVQTIDGGDISILTSEWGHTWGVGGKEDNGVFILLAVEEREIYIAPGYGLEHLLTAGINGEIIRNDIIPKFKQEDYYGGLDIGTDQLIKLFSGTYKKTESNEDGLVAILFIIFLFIGVIILVIIQSWYNKKKKNNNNGKNGGKNGGKSLTWMEKLFIAQTISNAGSSYNRNSGGGWFGGGGSGGGFSGGFGGGGFSGGGAGGKW